MEKKSILVGAVALAAFTMGNTTAFAKTHNNTDKVSVEASCASSKTDAKCGDKKTADAKCGDKKATATAKKTTDAKCGEGKCGGTKAKKAKKTTKATKPATAEKASK